MFPHLCRRSLLLQSLEMDLLALIERDVQYPPRRSRSTTTGLTKKDRPRGKWTRNTSSHQGNGPASMSISLRVDEIL